MPRNLDHRVEVVVPVDDARLQQEIERTFGSLLADNATAWELRPDGSWTRLRPKKGERARPTQTLLMRALRARERRRGISRRSP
jgi:polyphosphate kinase